MSWGMSPPLSWGMSFPMSRGMNSPLSLGMNAPMSLGMNYPMSPDRVGGRGPPSDPWTGNLPSAQDPVVQRRRNRVITI
jgi:hypothetical protein